MEHFFNTAPQAGEDKEEYISEPKSDKAPKGAIRTCLYL